MGRAIRLYLKALLLSLVILPFRFLMWLVPVAPQGGALNLASPVMQWPAWWKEAADIENREQDTLHKDCFAKPSPSSAYPHGVPCMNTNSLWPVFDIKTTVGWLLVSWLSMMEGKESWFKIGSRCDAKRKKPTKAGVGKTVLEVILS